MESGLFKLPENNLPSSSSSSASSTTKDKMEGDEEGEGEVEYAGNTPQGMAQRFKVPYLGKLPMDPNMMRACEEGKSFLEMFPTSLAAKPFAKIVQKLITMTTTIDNNTTTTTNQNTLSSLSTQLQASSSSSTTSTTSFPPLVPV